MQTVKSTLKLKAPVNFVAPILPRKQVIVIDQRELQQKSANSKLSQDVKPNANNNQDQNNKASKEQIKTNKTLSTPNIVVDQQQLIAEKIEKLRLEFNEILEFLQTHYLNCFNKKRKLLAIGIHKEWLKLHSDIFSKAKLSRFFAKYYRSTRYKNRLVVGAIRLNWDGSDSSQVTESEIAHLNKSLYSQQQAKKK